MSATSRRKDARPVGQRNHEQPAHARHGWLARLAAFPGNTRGQALTEYVILAAMLVIVAAYLYYPDNGIFYGIRRTYDKTMFVVGWPGP